MSIDDIINSILGNPILFITLCVLIYWIVYKSFTTDPDDPKNSKLEKEFDEFMKQTYHDIQNKEEGEDDDEIKKEN